MNTAVSVIEPRLKNIQVTEEDIVAYLADGRTITVPLVWSWRLLQASPEQRAKYEIIGDGEGIHWPDIDEDISVEGMLYGIPAPSPLHVQNIHVQKPERNGIDRSYRL